MLRSFQIRDRIEELLVNLRKDDVALDDVEVNRKMTQCACVHTKLNYLCHVASRRRRQNRCFEVVAAVQNGGSSSTKEKVSLW